MEKVPFIYIVFGANEVLKNYNYVTPEKLQAFISDDETFHIRPPLSECRLALRLLVESGFIKKLGEEYVKNCG